MVKRKKKKNLFLAENCGFPTCFCKRLPSSKNNISQTVPWHPAHLPLEWGIDLSGSAFMRKFVAVLPVIVLILTACDQTSWT